MPKGPQGQKRPADVIGAAIRVARIATGEEAEDEAIVKGRKGGKAGGPSRAAILSSERRREIAKQGAKARWGKPTPAEPEMKEPKEKTSE